ncbi:MAG: hypothetical protein MN733_01680 [Nitrososphaera sp.]|nr:hypothetical protein [Nitrososphaera sp.]
MKSEAYEVSYTKTIDGTITVEANSPLPALKMTGEILGNGEEYERKYDTDETHDYEVTYVDNLAAEDIEYQAKQAAKAGEK